ncbi:MAG: DUF1330 domain-containing protein [Spirochaetales bacterium]|nr:DUF1330 domain-containing protein [Spirochaetales bacterium]
MSIFLIACIKIKNNEMYQDYIRKAEPIIKKYQGKYILRSNKIINSNSKFNPDKIIIIEFPDIDLYKSCFASEEYKNIVYLRLESTESESFIVKNI